MNARKRIQMLAMAAVLGLAGAGCNPFNMLYFLTGGPETKVEPEFKLANKDREVTVLILAYGSPDVQADQSGLDRQLGTLVARQLEMRCLANKERVKIVPIHKVEKFKSDHPGWKSMGAPELGRQFEADFVIDLELVRFGLYEPGSHRSLFRGNAKIDVAVLDVRKPYDGHVYKRSITSVHPRTSGPRPVQDDPNIEKFRDEFVTKIATEVCWQFTRHVFSEECQCD